MVSKIELWDIFSEKNKNHKLVFHWKKCRSVNTEVSAYIAVFQKECLFSVKVERPILCFALLLNYPVRHLHKRRKIAICEMRIYVREIR